MFPFTDSFKFLYTSTKFTKVSIQWNKQWKLFIRYQRDLQTTAYDSCKYYAWL